MDRGRAPRLPGLAVPLRPAGALFGGQSVCQAGGQPWFLVPRQSGEVLSAALRAPRVVGAGAGAGRSLGRYVGLLRLRRPAAPGVAVGLFAVKSLAAGGSEVAGVFQVALPCGI